MGSWSLTVQAGQQTIWRRCTAHIAGAGSLQSAPRELAALEVVAGSEGAGKGDSAWALS